MSDGRSNILKGNRAAAALRFLADQLDAGKANGELDVSVEYRRLLTPYDSPYWQHFKEQAVGANWRLQMCSRDVPSDLDNPADTVTVLAMLRAEVERLTAERDAAIRGAFRAGQEAGKEIADLKIKLEMAKAHKADCQHERTAAGANAPRGWGSYATEVCRDCGAFRTHGHDAAKSNMSVWQPASEYVNATAERRDDE